MVSKRKVHKRLNKKCPECGGILFLMEYIREEENGVSYSENTIECNSCEYFEDLIDKKTRKNNYENER
jgi:hypothetical protein